MRRVLHQILIVQAMLHALGVPPVAQKRCRFEDVDGDEVGRTQRGEIPAAALAEELALAPTYEVQRPVDLAEDHPALKSVNRVDPPRSHDQSVAPLVARSIVEVTAIAFEADCPSARLTNEVEPERSALGVDANLGSVVVQFEMAL